MAITLKRGGPPPRSESRTGPKAAAKRWAGLFPGLGKKIKPRDMIFFTSQLSLMLEIGTSLMDALRAIEAQTKNPVFKDIIGAMHRDIREGRQLSEAMKRHPRAFDSVFISMIKAGETGGFLKKIMDGMVEMQEKRQALVAQLKSTMTYPAVLCVLGIFVVIFVLVGILPKFSVLFEGKESILPITTRVMMSLSASMQGFWWVYILACAGIVAGLRMWQKSDPGRAMTDRFLVSAPLISRLSNKLYICQFLRTLGHLMQSQVPLLEALGVTLATFRNRYYRRFIRRIMEHVEQGGRFSQPFAKYPYIMETVKQMVATGEEIGKLPMVMLRLAEFYDTEVDRELKTIAALIEPAALMMLGTAVGIIVSSVILPLFRIAHGIH